MSSENLPCIVFAACVALLATAGDVRAQEGIRPEIPPGTLPDRPFPEVGVTEHFDRTLPMDARFRDHEGRDVTLGEIFASGRPVLLTLVYFQCPSFCSLVLRGVAANLQQQEWTAGMQFDVLTLSVDPRDTPAHAADERRRVLGQYGRAEAERGWHFLVGEEAEIQRVTDAVGFGYRWDDATEQFAHPGVVTILQSSGRVARYLYGIEYPVNDVRLGLIEAAAGRQITIAERFLVYCYEYSTHEGRYVLVAWRVMRLGGVITMLLLGGLLVYLWRREVRKRDTRTAPVDEPSDTPQSATLRERALGAGES